MNYFSEMNSFMTCLCTKEEELTKNHKHVIVVIANKKMTPPNNLNKKIKKWKSKHKLKVNKKLKLKLKKLILMFQLKMKKKKYNKLKAMKAKLDLFKMLE